jgi:hypothetical protein
MELLTASKESAEANENFSYRERGRSLDFVTRVRRNSALRRIFLSEFPERSPAGSSTSSKAGLRKSVYHTISDNSHR